MLRLLADENLNGSIVRGLLRHMPSADVVRVQDVGLSGADDPAVLDWAARQGRILVSHDQNTIPKYAYARVSSGQAMPGVLIVNQSVSIGAAIEDLMLIVECGEQVDMDRQVIYLPLSR